VKPSLGLLVFALQIGSVLAAEPLPHSAKLRIGSTGALVPRYTSLKLVPPDYKTLIAADVRGQVRRFDVATGRPLDERAKEPECVLAVSTNGKRAVVSGYPIVVADLATGKKVATIQRPELDNMNQYGAEYALSADGKTLAYGGAERIWAGEPGNSPVISSGGKGTVFVWDVEKNKLLTQIHTIQRGAVDPVLSPDGKVLATSGQHHPLVSPATQGAQFVGPQPPRFPPVPGVVPQPGPAPKIEENRLEPDPHFTVQVWNVETGEELFRGQVTDSAASRFVHPVTVFSPDGKTLAAAIGSGPIELWDVKTGKHLHTLLGRTGQGHRLVFSPDGKTIVATTSGGLVQRWVVAEGRLLATERPPAALSSARVEGIAFADDRLVLWGGIGKFAVVWEMPSGKVLTPPRADIDEIHSLAFRANSAELVTSRLGGRVACWDVATGQRLGSVTPRSAGQFPYHLTISRDATHGFGWATVYDLSTGEDLFTLPAPPDLGKPGDHTFTTMSPSTDLRWVISMSSPYDERLSPHNTVLKAGGVCVVWDVTNRRRAVEVELPEAWGPRTATLSLSGARLVTVSQVFPAEKFAAAMKDGNADAMKAGRLVVTNWDVKTGKKLAELELPEESATDVSSVTAASERAVLIASRKKLWVVDYERGAKGAEIDTLRGVGNDSFGPIAFSADGKLFAAGLSTGEQGEYGARVYSWPQGKVLHTFTGHQGPITALAFSPDGKALASGSADTTVLLWDLTKIDKPK
jgi:WD40 repeat protein